MRINRLFTVSSLFCLLAMLSSCELLEEATAEEGLTTAEIVEGLKAALDVGLGNAVVSAEGSNGDGYLTNSLIKIPLPEEVANLQSQITNGNTLLKTGYAAYIALYNDGDDLFDDLVTAMNRGAGNAANKAAPIFGDAITNMTFQDAKTILEGGDSKAATVYFEGATRTELVAAFSPDLKAAIDSEGASQLYGSIVSLLSYEVEPLFGTTVGSLLDTDPNLPATLEEFATGKAVDGLFLLVGQEEEKIREDPYAWGSSIIEKVFGSLFE